jgi:hypothetical protein
VYSQISESIALILGNNVDECMQIESEVKSLYSKRSAIVHSGNDIINTNILNTIVNYSRHIILELLNNEEYKNINSVKDLYDLLRKKKYSH